MSENQTKKLTKGDLYRMYARSTFLLGSFNFERMQSMGFCVTMMPAIKRLYSIKEERSEEHRLNPVTFSSRMPSSA